MVNLPIDNISVAEEDIRPKTTRSSATQRSGSGHDAARESAGSSSNVMVFARFRPQTTFEEMHGGKQNCFFDPDGRSVSVTGEGNHALSTFQFSRVFSPEATQGEVYTQAVQPIVQQVVNGINASIIAYGQTGSGKTYTMMGAQGARRDFLEAPDHAEGLVSRTLRDLFSAISVVPAHVAYSVNASLVEIYQENMSDLLSDEGKKVLTIKEDKARRLFITNAKQFPVSTVQEVVELIHRGLRGRETAATKMNDHSSRSHAIVILNVVKRDAIECTQTTSQLYMVDLAGSEVVSKTEATGTVLDEAKCINSSLFALGRVISALSEGASHVPYRDSKLTRLLQHCFGGSSRTALVVNCSCSSFNRQETVASLQLGARSQKIVNKVVVHKIYTAEELRKILQETKAVVAVQKIKLNAQEREMALLRMEAARMRQQLQEYEKARFQGEGQADHCFKDLECEQAHSMTDSMCSKSGELSEKDREGEVTGDSSSSDSEEDGLCRVQDQSNENTSSKGMITTLPPKGMRLEDQPWCEPRFLCPISGRLMRNPTILADGNTYEECIARRYISGRNGSGPRSPLTGDLLAHNHLMPNTFARMLIQRSCPYNLDDIPPSVSLTMFPEVIELEILMQLEPTVLCRLACTCKHLRSAADGDDVWRGVLLNTKSLNKAAQSLYGELFKSQYRSMVLASRKPVDKPAAPKPLFSGLMLQPSR